MTQIKEEILEILSTLKIDGNNVKITEQLDRKLYVEVNKVLERIGGKWNKKAKAHIFDIDPTDRLNIVIECGELDPKVKTGYFLTPKNVVDQMIELAKLERGQLILEPSAGQGHIADEICNTLKLHTHEISVCEILPENIHILEEKGYINEGDFFTFARTCEELDIKYDRIIMNPPFEKQSDLEHVRQAYNILEDGGILVSIMSLGVTFRNNFKTKQFRDDILNYAQIIKLPEGSFKSSGTMVNSIIIVLEK